MAHATEGILETAMLLPIPSVLLHFCLSPYRIYRVRAKGAFSLFPLTAVAMLV